MNRLPGPQCGDRLARRRSDVEGQVQFRFFACPLSGWIRRFRRTTYRVALFAFWPTMMRPTSGPPQGSLERNGCR
jgi:hypothetical protein